jgi:hypothetical protein
VRRPLRAAAGRLVGGLLAATLLTAVLLVGSAPATAHTTTVGFSHIVLGTRDVDWTLYLDPYHLNDRLRLDADADRYVTAEEVTASGPSLRELALAGVEVRDGDVVATPRVESIRLIAAREAAPESVSILGDLPVVEIRLHASFVQPIGDYELAYGLFFVEGTGDHRNTALVSNGSEERYVILDQLDPVITPADAVPAPPAVRPGLLVGPAGGLAVAAVALEVRRRRRRPQTPIPSASAVTADGTRPFT